MSGPEIDEALKLGVREDLERIRRRGFTQFSMRHVTTLGPLCTTAPSPGNEQPVREALLRHLLHPGDTKVAIDPATGAVISASDLHWESKFALTLYRATLETSEIRSLETARDQAGALRPTPIQESMVRRAGGCDEQLLLKLRDALIREFAESERPASVETRSALLSEIEEASKENSPRVTVRARPTHFEPAEWKLADYDKAYWSRPTTSRDVNALSSFASLTLFAGSDGPSDVGRPLHADIVAPALLKSLSEHPAFVGLDAETLAEVAKAAPDMYSGIFLGSAIRGLHMLSDSNDDAPDQAEAHILRDLRKKDPDAPPRTSGFISEPILDLASARARVGLTTSIVSTHHDKDLEVSLAGRVASGNIPEGYVEIVKLHQPGRNTVAEFDVVRSYGAAHDVIVRQSLARLTELLRTQPTLFVGTSLTDPGVLGLIEATRDSGQPRHAVLLLNSRFRGETDSTRKMLHHAILAARYVHLGIQPIIVDYPAQVPQLLLEVALKVEHPKAKSYGERIEEWWLNTHELFGLDLGPKDRHGLREDAQTAWHRALRKLRDLVETAASESTPEEEPAERFAVEVWIRRGKAQPRELFRWASSEEIIARTTTTETISLRETGDVTQLAFREGARAYNPVHNGIWRYALAMSLYLAGDSWNHLQIGVVKVLSSRERGTLSQVANSEQKTWDDIEPLILDQLSTLASETVPAPKKKRKNR